MKEKKEKKPVVPIDRQKAENLMDILLESKGDLESSSLALFWSLMKSGKISLQSLFLSAGWGNIDKGDVQVRIYQTLNVNEEYDTNWHLGNIRTLDDFFAIKRVVLFYNSESKSNHIRIDHSHLPYGYGKHTGISVSSYGSKINGPYLVVRGSGTYDGNKSISIDFSEVFYPHSLHLEFKRSPRNLYNVKASEYVDYLSVDTYGADLELSVHSAKLLSIRNSKSTVLYTNSNGYIDHFDFIVQTDDVYNNVSSTQHDFPILYIPNGILNCGKFSTRIMSKFEYGQYQQNYNRPIMLIGKIDKDADYGGLYQREWVETKLKAMIKIPTSRMGGVNDVLVTNYSATYVQSTLCIAAKSGGTNNLQFDLPQNHCTTVGFDSQTEFSSYKNSYRTKTGRTDMPMTLLCNRLSILVKGNSQDLCYIDLTTNHKQESIMIPQKEISHPSLETWTYLDFEFDKMKDSSFTFYHKSSAVVEDNQALIDYVETNSDKARSYHCCFKNF